MDIIKKPYEISLWDDILTFVGQKDGKPYDMEGAVENDYYGEISHQYYKEKKLCVIGTENMDSPIRAVKPKFTQKVNGEKTLTFTMYSQYWDESTSSLEWNPFMQYLTNERKVKLKYDKDEFGNDKWHDFIIKNISEDSSTKAFTYSCKDLFVNELSKTGFELEFDNELGNNMGNLEYLAGKILEGSDWDLGDNDTILQYLEQPLYRYELPSNTTLTPMYSPEENKSITAIMGQVVYVFYNQTSTDSKGKVYIPEGTIQVLYDKSQSYTKDDKNIIIGFSPTAPDGAINCTMEVKANITRGIDFCQELRGNCLIKSQKTEFDPKLKRTVGVYKDSKNKFVYGYTETDYISPVSVSSYVANPSDFISTTGWSVGKASSNDAFPKLTLEVYPELTKNNYTNYEGSSYLCFKPSASDQVLMNSGLVHNRSQIDGFTAGEKYIFSLEVYSLSNKELKRYDNWDPYIFEYDFSEGMYEDKTPSGNQQLFTFSTDGLNKGENNVWIGEATCNYSISKEALKSTTIGIFIKERDNKTDIIYIKNMQFYPLKTYKDAEGKEVQYKPGDKLEAQIKTKWCYYNKDTAYTSEDDLSYLYIGTEPSSSYTPYYGENAIESFEKVRSITAKESNRFNLLQSLCELYECWMCMDVEHESTGEIKLDKDYRQQKKIYYRQFIGKDNYIGFKYGINLKSIKRTLDSNGTISKIIVKNNSNEFAPNGFCTISRAQENPSGENTIYNFDYYVGQGLISFSTLNNDLYSTPGEEPISSQGYLCYYKRLKVLNDEAQEKAEILAKLVKDIAKYDSQYQTYKVSHDSAQQDLAEKEIEFRDLTGFEITDNSDWGNWANNKEVKKIVAAIARDKVVINDHGTICENQANLKSTAEKQQKAIEKRLEEIRETKLGINLEFYKKYSRFIQEGSWISEDYVDDNLYYIDALSTLYTSSRPQVNYTIDVIELSQLAGYENFKFEIGDKTYVEDKEFFGWAYDGSNRLYREEVIVSEIDIELDSPEANKIKVQNYKTQFEDLFQRVVATTQQIQFSTGEYQRSAAIVEPGGTINITTLQNSFLNNAITLQNAKDQSVIIGDDGITTTNLMRPSEVLRIISGGIFISQDGGVNWTTGISASGINASCITTGQLNVSEVNLTMGANVAFRWDSLGISAYKRDEQGISPGTFTRFDQFGLYGISNDDDFDALEGEGGSILTRAEALKKIKSNASFGLTWDGFWLKSNGTDGYVSISSDRDFEVVRTSTSGSVTTEIPIIKIGRLGEKGNSEYYGIKINNQTGSTVFEVDQYGELWLRTKMSVQTTEGEVAIGTLGKDKSENGYTKVPMVINANNKFKVYENGHIEGADAHFSGGSTFEGAITATGGTIGGLTIEEWSQVGFTVEIESSNGIIFKSDNVGDITTLTARLYRGGKEIKNNQTLDGKIVTLSYQWQKSDPKSEDGFSNISGALNQKYTVPENDMEENSTVTYFCQIIIDF